MRGRVMSVYNLAFRAGIPLGSLGLGQTHPHVRSLQNPGRRWFMLVAVSAYFLMAKGEVNTADPLNSAA